jgi:hypothetical protein
MIEVKEYKETKIRTKIDGKKFSLQFLPEKLDSESAVTTFEYSNKKLKSAYLIDIVHNLILKYYFRKDNHFRMSSLVLRDKYGFLYNYYMEYLKEKGIIEMISNYLVGKNVRIYKLSESIIDGKITRFKNEDKVLLKKYKEAVSLLDDGDVLTNTILPEVKKKLVSDLFSVKIHGEKAIFFLDSTVQTADIYNKNVYSVQCISDGQIFYHFDNYGRMHTNFTILKSFIRKNCLSIDGDETYELDIKNSQPLFLNKIIESDGAEIVDQTEWELFKYLTKSGLFYQYIMDNSGIKDKEKIKKIIYKVLFGKNYSNSSDKMFSKLFPTIHNFIKYYKKKYSNYKILSHKLQNLESNLIFNKIILEIMETNPEIKIVTVHDSIVFSKKWKNIVEEIFYKNLEKEFNI